MWFKKTPSIETKKSVEKTVGQKINRWLVSTMIKLIIGAVLYATVEH